MTPTTDISASTPGSAVLITGGRGGIGRALAEGLNACGFFAIVTVRKVEDVVALKAEGLTAVVMDVTNSAHTEPAVMSVNALLASQNLRLVGVIANAGINPEGDRITQAAGGKTPTELSEASVATAIFATNVVGVAVTARAFLPMLREAGGAGRLIIIGSYFGTIAGAIGEGHAYYEASKFAVEGLCDNLRRSEAKRGVAVSLVKPGNISTAMNAVHGEDPPEVVLRAVRHALGCRPRHRYHVGRVKGMGVWLLCWLFNHLPTWLTDRLL